MRRVSSGNGGATAAVAVAAALLLLLLGGCVPAGAQTSSSECCGKPNECTACDDVPAGCTTITGTLTIASNDDVTDLDGCAAIETIEHNLTILSNSALTDISGLAALSYVGGTLTIQENDELTDVSLPALEEVGVLFSVQANIRARTALYPSLTYAGSLAVWDSELLTSLDLTALTNVGDFATFVGLGVEVFELPALATVGGQLMLDAMRAAEVRLPNVTSVGAEALITSNLFMHTLELPALASLSGGLDLFGNNAMTAYDGDSFASLRATGDFFYLSYNDALTDISGFAGMTAIATDFVVAGSPGVDNIDALSRVTSVGGAVIIENNSPNMCCSLATMEACWGDAIAVEPDRIQCPVDGCMQPWCVASSTATTSPAAAVVAVDSSVVNMSHGGKKLVARDNVAAVRSWRFAHAEVSMNAVGALTVERGVFAAAPTVLAGKMVVN